MICSASRCLADACIRCLHGHGKLTFYEVPRTASEVVDTMEPEHSPSAQIVGQEFVKQYYTMLNAAPEHLHRFYSNNSNFIHGGMDGRPDEQQAVTGQAEIHKKIMSLNFNNCHARICQVDCQSSVGGSVVVQVIGELSNNGQPMRKFVQSFVLAAQSAKKYYVHIDIFRYQDIYQQSTPESDLSQSHGQYLEEHAVTGITADESVADGDVQSIELQHQQPEREEPAQATDSVDDDGTSSELVNDGPSMTLTQQPDTAAAAAVVVDEQVVDEMKGANDSTTQDDVTTGEDDEASREQGKADELLTESTDSTAQPVPAKPMTWAALAGRNAAVAGSSAVVASAASGRTQTAAAPVTGSAGRSPAPDNSQPSKTAASSSMSATAAVDDRSVNGSRVMVNGANKDVTPRRVTSSSSLSGCAAAAVNYPDSQQVFVGNLPQHLTDQDLIEFFEQYGRVLDFRINRKTGGLQAGNNIGQKNFGFMVFESPDTVDRVLSERPIYLGKLRLNIEEKKPKEELVAARQSVPRGGRRGGYGRVGNIADDARTSQ